MRLKHKYFPFFFFAIIVLLAARKFLFVNGYVSYGEFLDSNDYAFFLKDFLHAWSDYTTLGHSNIGFPTLFGLNPTFFITSPGLQIPWLFIMSVLQLFLGPFTSRIYILLALFAPFISMYWFSKHWFKNLEINSFTQSCLAYISALIYATSSQFADRMYAGHLHYVFGYALFPVLLLLIDKAIMQNLRLRWFYILAYGGVVSILFWLMLHMLAISVFPLLIYFFIFVVGDWKKVKSFFLLLSVGSFIGILLNIHAWLPSIFFSETYPFLKDITYNLGALYSNSQLISFSKIVNLNSGFEKNLLSPTLFPVLFFLKLLLPVLAVLGTIIYRKKRQILFAFFICLVGIVFAMGINSPFRDLYLFFYKYVFFFKPLRDNSKFVILYAFGLSLLVPLVFISLDRIFKKKFLFVVLLFTLYTIFTHPLYMSGNFNNAIVPFQYPQKYELLKKKFSSIAGYYRIAFYPNDSAVGNYSWFPKTSNGPVFFNVYNSFSPLSKSLGISNRTTSDLSSRYLDFLESNLDKQWAVERLGQERIRFLAVDQDAIGYKKIIDHLHNNPAVQEVKVVDGFTVYEIKKYNKNLLRKAGSAYYFGDKIGISELPADLSIIDLGINDPVILSDNYSDVILLYDKSLSDVFLTSLKRYRFSFFPEVRFNFDGGNSFIVAGDNLRRVSLQGISFYNPEAVLTVGQNQISKKSQLKKGTYRVFLSVLNSPEQSKKITIKIDDFISERTVLKKSQSTFTWIDFGEFTIKNQDPSLQLKNRENATLVVDSLVIVPKKTYESLEKRFLSSVSGKKVYFYDKSTHLPTFAKQINQIYVFSQSYSPYWYLCGNKSFVINFYAIGTRCRSETSLQPKFIPETFYIFSIALTAVFYIILIAMIVRFRPIQKDK